MKRFHPRYSKFTKALFLFSVFCHLTVLAQPETVPLSAGVTADGVTYFLPKTVFRLHVLVEKRTFQPGPYANYASRYLHLEGIRQDAEQDCQVVGMDMTQIGVRDTSKCYSLRLKGGKNEAAEVVLSEDGVLLAFNDQPMKTQAHRPFQPVGRQTAVNPKQYLSSEVQMASSKAKQAQLVARQIADLQERRQQLLMGEADEMPQDDRQLQTILREIDRSQQALLSLFTGRETCDTTEHTLELVPHKEVKREVVFRISRQQGLVDKDDLSGVPYYLTVEDLYKTDTAKYPLAENKKNEGLYVNVPGRIRLSFFRDDEPLATFEKSAAQFGFVELRNAYLLKRYVTHLQLHPATGVIVKTVADMEKK